jgi:hypothetical protein
MARATLGDITGSKDFHALNPHLSAGQPAKLEPAAEGKPLEAAPVKKGNPSRYYVRLVDVRPRLLDEDNLCAKYHVDALRYAGVIPDDRPELCRITTTQRKCAKGEEPHTEIEVEEVPA